MHPLEKKFSDLREKGEGALVSYMMVGYPDYESSMNAFRILLEEGTDILEVGFPFSDPVADGPAIQEAHQVSLKNGTDFSTVLRACSELKYLQPDVPLLLMVYYNPVFRIGLEKFAIRAKENGIDGLIVPDLPAEESDELGEVLRDHGLSLVLLASPTTGRERLKMICEKTSHMTYYVSVTGTTGARSELPFEEIEEHLNLYREVCSKPVVVGFGVSKGEHSRRICSMADGVVVGSLFVRLAGQKNFEALKKKAGELKEGTRGLQPTTS
jgi:tryptophan synthase alpha chain